MIKVLQKGDKLICANADGWEGTPDSLEFDSGPERGDIVTVRDFGIECYNGDFRPIVWLEGYPGVNPDDAFFLDFFDLFEETDS